MDHYIGIDVACKTSFVCAVDEEGKQVCLKSIPTNVQAIIKCLNHNKLNATCIGIETGTECHRLAAGLKEFGYNVEIIDARKSAPILEAMNVNKNGPNNALGLANLLRAQMHSKVNLKSFEQLDQLALVNSRRLLVDQRTAIGNQIRGLAKVHGIKVIGQFDPNNWKPVISSHPNASQLFRKTIEVQLEMYEQFTKGIERYDQNLEFQSVALT